MPFYCNGFRCASKRDAAIRSYGHPELNSDDGTAHLNPERARTENEASGMMD